MRRVLPSAVTVLALALGSVNAQSSDYFGVSIAFGEFGTRLPLPGVHLRLEDLIAHTVALKVRLTGLTLGSLFTIGIAGADVMWTLPTDDDASVRTYVGGGPGFAIGTIGGGMLETLPHASVKFGASLPSVRSDVFLESRAIILPSRVNDTVWWFSIAVGFEFRSCDHRYDESAEPRLSQNPNRHTVHASWPPRTA